MSVQLTLGIQLRDDASFENYMAAANHHVLKYLKSFANNCGERFIYLWGSNGVGKSHLLQACCHALDASDTSIMYLPLREYKNFSPDILEGMEHLSLLCVDDIDMILGDAHWEEALMNCYNRMLNVNGRLLMSASCPPSQLKCCLPDLGSRLAAGLIFQVQALNDQQQIQVLQVRACNRGLQLSDEVAQYLLHRYPRDMATLSQIFDQLDRSSLQAKRRLTIPFVREVLSSQ